MKSIFTIAILGVLFFTQGCIEHKTNDNSNHIIHLAELGTDSIPHKKYLNFDSLTTFIPGKNGFELPEIIITSLPKPLEIQSISEIVPGVSYLPQTFKELIDHQLPIKSSSPLVIDYIKSVKQNSIQFGNPVVTDIPGIIHLSPDSVPYYKDIAIRRGLVSLQHGDSIFPPQNVNTLIPFNFKALPFNHKDYALFDIRVLGEDQNLPNSYIRAIQKDDKGVFWFGTHTGGLISYDGQYFKQYTTSSGISSDMVMSLLIDKNNNIWIGSGDNGVSLFDGNSITKFTTKQGLASNNIQEIMEDRNGNIWFATSKGASRYNGKTVTTYSIKKDSSTVALSSIYEDLDGNIWLGTFSTGVVMFTPNQEIVKGELQDYTTYTQEDGLARNIILSISQDHHGNMWFGTHAGGVSKFDGSKFTNYNTDQGLGNNGILSIIEDSYYNMWFGTFGNGVTRFNGKSFSHYTTKEGLSDNYVRTLFDDKNGNLWVGTDGGGISSFTMNSFKHFNTENGLSNNLVLAIEQDERNRMWFGTFEGGVIIYDEPEVDGQKGKLTQINTKNGLAHNTVATITKDNQNNYWFGTFENGVSMLSGTDLDLGKIKISNYSVKQGFPNEVIRSIIHDKKGNTWFGTEGGVVKYDGEKFVTITKKEGLGSNKILSIYEDNSGGIWFGSLGGGVTLLKNDTLTNYTIENGFVDNTVWTQIQDNNGVMWFGTNGGGLTCFDGNTFKTFSKKDGLSNNYVFSLIIDDANNLWVGTTRGLNQIKLMDSVSYRDASIVDFVPNIINFGKMDGLKSSDFFTNSALHDNRNRLWWGTSSALSMLDINKYTSVDKGPIVRLHEVVINSKIVDFRKLKSDIMAYSLSGLSYSAVKPFSNIPTNLSLPYDSDQLILRFSATDWYSPNQIRYQYILSGFDKDWSMVTKKTEVDYRNVPPGRYTFMIRAIGKSGNWGETIEYSFAIRPPFWLTWWALIIYGFAIVISIWLLITWRVNIVKQQKIVLENLIYDRTKELDNSRKIAEQATIAKSQFIATMSHEIRTPLNAIMGLTYLAINTSPNPKQEDYLQKIDRSANTLLSLINDILDFSKIEAGKMQLEKANFDLEILINSVIVLNAQDACKKGLEFVVDYNSNVPKLLIGDPLRIGQVITNLVSNAIKFTTSGEVVIHIDIGKKINDNELKLQIAVADSGIGISESNIPHLFDEFSQADSSTTRKYGGTGLGLTISKKLISMMNGRIWLESKPKQGTTFFFDCLVGVQSWETTSQQSIPAELKQFNILVCDNNDVALKSLVSTIKSFGLKVDAASSSKDVIELLKEKTYELLLIDQQLDEMSGIDTVLLINNNKEINPIKSILITDSKWNKKDDIEGESQIGGYLSKPNIPSVVLEQILAVFGMQVVISHHNIGNNLEAERIKECIPKCNILLAEDNEINRQVVFELLDNVGINVDVVDDGAAAVKKTQQNKYDLVLMDLHMPIMDGYTSATHIRKGDNNIPIIAITADAVSSIKLKCESVGINDIILKPISPNLLYSTILKWVNHEKDNSSRIRFNDSIIDSNSFNLLISDLDSQTGVKRFGGNVTLYMKMLIKFAAGSISICSNLKGLIADNKLEEAHLVIHTLKGESGNIGANKVFELAKLNEKAILANNLVDFYSTLDKLDKCIIEIVSDIENNPQVAHYIKDADSQLIDELITKLVYYLSSNNPSAFDVLDQLATKDIGKLELDAITKAINKGNTKKAIQLLNNL